MKKILSICLVLVMVMSFNLTAFAKGGFVNSPSENLAPEIVDSSDDGIVIHSYAGRHELTEKEREDLEDAYDSIKGSTDLSNLNANLGSLAKNKNINPKDLSVSDLFNIGYNGKNPKGPHSITLSADTLRNFVALMTYVNGKWQLIEGAEIVDGNLVFNTAQFGPYAFVVNTSGVVSPQTGVADSAQSNSNNVSIIFYAVIMLASAGAALVLYRKSKKYTA